MDKLSRSSHDWHSAEQPYTTQYCKVLYFMVSSNLICFAFGELSGINTVIIFILASCS